MIIHEIVGTEDNLVYREIENDNSLRQLDFLLSMIRGALSLDQIISFSDNNQGIQYLFYLSFKYR